MNVSSKNVCESAVLLADFSDLPPKPPRSKLEPHRELIRELRRKGRMRIPAEADQHSWLKAITIPV
jgi:hypothetical protein